MKTKCKTFRISYKVYLGETSDYCHEDLLAVTKEEALQRFFKRNKIEDGTPDNPDTWRWWDGDWWAAFKNIQEVQVEKCVTCGGDVVKVVG